MMYAAAALVDEARRAGYPDLTEGALRVMVHRGQFPEAREGRGTKSDPKRWGEEDKVRLLDWCFLKEQGSQADTMQLGLWFHGHDVSNAGALLEHELEAIQTYLAGRVVPEDIVQDDQASEEVHAHIRHVLDESGVLADLVRGEYPGFHSLDWEEYERISGISADILRTFTYPATDPSSPDRVIYPPPAPPREVIASLQHDEAHLRLGYALGLQRFEEGESYWSLPTLTTLVRRATEEELKTARWHAWVDVGIVMDEADSGRRVFPSTFSIDVRQLLGEYGDTRHLLGAPALQPLMVLIAATSLHDGRSQTRSTRNLYLMALAIRRLLAKPQRLAHKRDALLLAVFAFHPKYSQDPKIIAEFQRQMKVLRLDPSAEARMRALMNGPLLEGRDEDNR
jgi:hypothetical protein